MSRVVNGLNAGLHHRFLAGTALRAFSTGPAARPNFEAAATPNALKPGKGADCCVQWRRLCEPVRRVRSGRLPRRAVLLLPGFSRIFSLDFFPRHRPIGICKWLKINGLTFWSFNAAVRLTAAALAGRKGRVALLGLIEQEIDQKGFAGFRSVAEKAGLTCMEPQQDKGNTAEATRVAAGIIQGTSDLAGMAGFDSESGPGMAQAIKEARKSGQILATCVEAEEPHLRFLEEGVLTACVGQKRELFTYLGVKSLFDLNHAPIKFSKNDKAAGVAPIASNYNTGTYTVTRETVDFFLGAASQ